jgi:phosphinothricin acetyltransferase
MTSSPSPVRTAKLPDLPAIVRIYNQSVPDRNATCDLFPTTLEARIPWFHGHNSRYPLWVGVEGDRVVGWACISSYNEKPGYALTIENSVYIDRDRRGHGWGGRLLEHTLKEAKRLGYHAVIARVFAHNPVSLGLHRKFGFEEQGVLKEVALLDGNFLDVAYLVRLL